MPVDTSIIGRLQPLQGPSPLEVVSTVAQIQGLREQTEQRRLAGEAARQKAMDEAAIRRAMTEAGGDLEKALPALRTINPVAALKLETDLGEARQKKFAAMTEAHKFQLNQLDVGIGLLEGDTDPERHRVILPLLHAMSPQIAEAIGETYDPAKIAQFKQVGLSAKDTAARRHQALELFTKGDAVQGLATYLSTVRPEEGAQAWNGILQNARDLGLPEAVTSLFGAYSPENVQRAASLTITPEKQAELAGQAAGRAQTAAHQTVLEQQGAERIALSRQQGAQRIAIARQRLAQGTGTSQDRDDLISAVVENPGLWDQITPTERGKIAGDLQRRGFTGFGKPLPEAAVKKLGESDSAIASLTDLKEILKKNEQYIGPLAGFQALNPYSEARKAQADIDRVRQRVGKALEGGVLRKEDEEKYKKILATLYDEPSTAIYKVDQLIKDIQRDKDSYVHQQRLSGRRVPQSEMPPGETRRQQTYQVGQILTVNGQRVRVTKLLPNGKYEGEVVR